MITTSLWRRLQQLLPGSPLQIGEIVDVTSYDVTVLLPGGDLIKVRGSGSIGQRVFIRDGIVEGDAPTLPVVEIDI